MTWVRGDFSWCTGVSINEVMEKTGKSNATVKRYLQILKTIKLIEFKGSAKTGKYFIAPKAVIKMKAKWSGKCKKDQFIEERREEGF